MLGCHCAVYAQLDELSAEESAAAAADYQKYCALCHGADRQGYVNDHAPSLRSESLLASGFPGEIRYAIGYGRRGTPMGAFSEEMGGPMNREEIHRLTRWLLEQPGRNHSICQSNRSRATSCSAKRRLP